MCTVLIRVRPGAACGVLIAAVRDEFADRGWAGPAQHWLPGSPAVGGIDLRSRGTWLAVWPGPARAAVVVNGAEAGGVRPDPARSRGALPLAAIGGRGLPMVDPEPFAGFHLLLADGTGAQVLSWDGRSRAIWRLAPGDHTLSFYGVDDPAHPRIRRMRAAFGALPDPGLAPGTGTGQAWGAWTKLLADHDRQGAEPDALLVDRLVGGRRYRSSSAALVALGRQTPAGRYDFTADPRSVGSWQRADSACLHKGMTTWN